MYLLVGLLLAFQTSTVKIKELRDTKVIVVSVLGTFVVSVVLTVIGFFVTDDPNTFYGLLAFFILALVSCVMGILFVPGVRVTSVLYILHDLESLLCF